MIVKLVMKGGGVTRTRHLRARMNLGKKMVDQKLERLMYLNAEDMDADGFS